MINYPPRPCVICGTDFKPWKTSQLCCSTRCSYTRWQETKTKWARTRLKVNYTDIFLCFWCLKKTIRKRSDQATCGRPSCQMKQANWKNTIRRSKEDDIRRLGQI